MAIDTLSNINNGVAINRTGMESLSRWRLLDSLTVNDALRLPSSTSVLLSDSGKRQSIFSELSRNVGSLASADAAAPYFGRSDDTAVLSSAQRSGGVARAVDVEVSRVASAQVLQSPRFADEDRTVVGTGTLSFRFGRLNDSDNSFLPDSNRTDPVVIRVENGTLSGIANTINRADIGVRASTVSDAGGFRLDIRGTASGRDRAFQIAVADDDGNSIDDLRGLSRLSFQAVEPVGYGRNLLQIQPAADTELRIGDRVLGSANARVVDSSGQATFTAASVGRTSVEFGRDPDTAVKSARTLVDAFNGSREKLSNLSSRVGSDAVAQLDLAASGARDADAKRNLADSGVARLADGRLNLDEAALRRAFVEDADSVSEVLGNFGQRLVSLADNETKPYVPSWQTQLQTLFGNAQTGLSGLGIFGYSPTTRSAYGLSQYLTVARL